ncbi:hypothetical protein E2C01_073617 [Portunus trituberculatus]|uniref:Uncharacterized protein n=1 Tax=Portunus trituberculatus TaxID=210409 RepID=A0A5B7IEE3_PORTR|nr:hypothetical protein [Portunus trituberculatus]
MLKGGHPRSLAPRVCFITVKSSPSGLYHRRSGSQGPWNITACNSANAAAKEEPHPDTTGQVSRGNRHTPFAALFSLLASLLPLKVHVHTTPSQSCA